MGWRTANIYSRKRAPAGGRKSREGQRERPRLIATQESGRWIKGALGADRVLGEASMVTVIDDREGDIYEKFVTPGAAHVDLLGRADHDRVMSDGVRRFASMAALPNVVGRRIDIQAKSG